MSTNPTRRTILSALGAAAAVHAAPLGAIEPLRRPARQRMRLSLAAYSMRKYLGMKPGEQGAIDMPTFVDWAAGLDLDAVELTSYWLPPEPTAAYLAALKRRCHIAGLDISGGAIGNNFTYAEGEEPARGMDYTKKWIDWYAALGVPVIRVFAGVPPKGTTEEVGVARAVERLRIACDYAEKTGVILAIENHDYLTRIDRLVEIVRQVDSPAFAVNLDTGNVADPDPYAALAKIAPYAANVQVKIEIPNGKGGREPTDLSRIAHILRDAKYSGYVVLEYEGQEEPYEAVPVHLAALRKVL